MESRPARPAFLYEVNGMGKFVDITGNKYNRLLVFERIGTDKNGNATYLCLCDCGNWTEANANELKNNHKKSCGCLHNEINSEFGKRKSHFIHGESKTNLHKIWQGMIQRCHNPKNPAYSYYGGRGIFVCPEWHDYTIFSKWAHDNCYVDGLSIERIDNDLEYSPDNCKWIPRSEQSKNRRSVLKYEYNGATKTLREWGEEVGIKPKILWSRIHSGWTIERALTQPVRDLYRGQ